MHTFTLGGVLGPESRNYIEEESMSAEMRGQRDIGDQATWTLSSSKEDNGVFQLRDDNLESYWQSDGSIPHSISIQFLKKQKVSEIALYLDSKQDDSYTPELISIRGGVHPQDLREITRVSLRDPCGWIRILLNTRGVEKVPLPYVYAAHFQILILQMNSSGKDTHIRQVKIFGYDPPVQDTPGEQREGTLSFPVLR